MILYLLPILDIITALVLILHVNFGAFPFSVVLVPGIYLSFKGLIFAKSDFASKIDLLCGFYVILVAFGLLANKTAALIILIWLMQKALLAMLPLR